VPPGCVQEGIVLGAKLSPLACNIQIIRVSHLQGYISQRTIHDVLPRHVRDILGKDDSKATRLARQHKSTIITYRSTDHERAQVPVDVAVEEPRTGVVREEPDRDIIASVADGYDIADDWVHKVV
jgi:hypothetical protein